MPDHSNKLRTIAERSKARIDALGLKGSKTRADALLHYWTGAAAGAELAGDAALAQQIGVVCALSIAVRGELALVDLITPPA